MLQQDTDAGIRVLTLDRPPLNAIDLDLVEQMTQAFAGAANDPECRACVVTGASGVFTAGIDTKAVPGYDRARRARTIEAITELVAVCYGIDKPLVAAVSGHAIGAGLILMLMCDHRVAVRGDYRLGLTEAAAGLPFPAGPREIVHAELSPELGRRLAIGSATHAADNPMFAGLLDEYTDPQDLLPTARAAADRLAAMPAFAVVKAQLRRETRARIETFRGQKDPLLKALGLE